MSNIPSQLKLNFQDEFFVYLDRILVPIKGVEFEQMALDTAFYIAHEYGSKLDFLHIGKTRKPFFEKYFNKLAKYEIEFDLKIVKKQNISKAIIDHWREHRQSLVVMSGRRKPTLFDKITISSISNSVIPHIQAEILQVFPPSMLKLHKKIKNLAVLLPYSDRDPFLLRWASAIAAPQKGATVKVYHVAEVPRLIPLSEARNEVEIKKEEKTFREYIDEYSRVFGRIIQPKFIIGHDLSSSLEFIFEKDEPDMVLIGCSRRKTLIQKITKSLSNKIRDKLLTPGVCVHHMLEK